MSESVETAHGTVAYETATCVSCGEEFNKEEMADVVVGEMAGFNTYSTFPDELKFADGYDCGRLCRYCQNNPASYHTASQPVASQIDPLPPVLFAMIVGIIVGCVLTLMVVSL